MTNDLVFINKSTSPTFLLMHGTRLLKPPYSDLNLPVIYYFFPLQSVKYIVKERRSEINFNTYNSEIFEFNIVQTHLSYRKNEVQQSARSFSITYVKS